MGDKDIIDQHAKETRAWDMLCARLGRDPMQSDETDTCSLRAAWKAMLAFSAQEAANSCLQVALDGILPGPLCGERWNLPDDESVSIQTTFGKLRFARAAIALATGKDR